MGRRIRDRSRRRLILAPIVDLPEVHSGESHVAAAGSNLRTVRGLTFEDIEDPFGISTSENPRSLSYNAWVSMVERTGHIGC